MTEQQARNIANVVMAAAALGAAVIVVRNPKLRRLAWQLARQYATGPLAAWTAGTVRTAWDESATSPALDRAGTRYGATRPAVDPAATSYGGTRPPALDRA
jgi:hypothetical protein